MLTWCFAFGLWQVTESFAVLPKCPRMWFQYKLSFHNHVTIFTVVVHHTACVTHASGAKVPLLYVVILEKKCRYYASSDINLINT